MLSRADVDDMYAELGLPGRRVHVREDVSETPPRSPRSTSGSGGVDETTVALTCLHSVAQRLTAADVPFPVLSHRRAIRAALRTATLLGANHRLEETQPAVAVVDVPTLRETSRRTAPRHARDELRLTVHRLLLQEAQRIDASVSPVSDHCFLVTATRGSLAAATDGFRVPPFIERARTELSIDLEVGVGMGRTAQDAETHARAALSRAQSAAGPAVSPSTAKGVPCPRPPPRRPGHRGRRNAAWRPSPGWPTSWPVGERARGQRGDRGPGARGHARTARRLLHSLVEEGLAWPLPPSRAPPGPGRPRQFYRLVTEKLERRGAAR